VTVGMMWPSQSCAGGSPHSGTGDDGIRRAQTQGQNAGPIGHPDVMIRDAGALGA